MNCVNVTVCRLPSCRTSKSSLVRSVTMRPSRSVTTASMRTASIPTLKRGASCLSWEADVESLCAEDSRPIASASTMRYVAVRGIIRFSVCKSESILPRTGVSQRCFSFRRRPGAPGPACATRSGRVVRGWSTLRDQGGVIRRRAQPDVLSRGISDRKSAATTGRRRDGRDGADRDCGRGPLRGVTDARPEMARGVAVEDRTAGAHETVRYRFTANRRGLTPPAGSAPRSIHAKTAPRTRA